jgi:hypothetical protein
MSECSSAVAAGLDDPVQIRAAIVAAVDSCVYTGQSGRIDGRASTELTCHMGGSTRRNGAVTLVARLQQMSRVGLTTKRTLNLRLAQL